MKYIIELRIDIHIYHIKVAYIYSLIPTNINPKFLNKTK